jgi:hypothetical protein
MNLKRHAIERLTGSANRTEHTWESLLEFVGNAELWHASEWEQVQ